MNRTIKFRGKHIDTGEWLYGDLVHSADMQRIGILVNDANSYDECEVLTETVGQFIGKKDKNGKEIYDGDIVEVNNRCEKNRFCIIVRWWPKAMAFCAFDLNKKEGVPMSWFSDVLNNPEVIGNIHDNPELLK